MRGMRWTILMIAATVGVFAIFANLGLVENGLRSFRDSLRHQSASGELHIVEIDAHSLQKIDRWPWPRSEHARLIDALTKAGARTIAFDVDFSSRSTPEQDRQLEAALARAGGAVILPTFRQVANTPGREVVESLPVDRLREHSFLGAVSILPDRDGYVRNAPLGIITQGTPRPSLSAMLAGHAGSAFAEFPIDFSIDPATIPRHSFVDVSQGGAAGALAGKDVLVGATSVELGDRYAVPRYGVIPGVVLQALATETLRQGLPIRLPSMVTLAIGLLAAWWITGALRQRQIAVRATVAAIGGMAALTLLEEWFGITGALVPALSALGAAAVPRAILISLDARLAAAQIDVDSGLPNRRALCDRAPERITVAGMIDRYDEIAATLGSARMGAFVARIAERVAPAVDAAIFRIEERVIAWVALEDMNEDMADRLRALLLHPVEIDGRRIDVRVALGVCYNDEVATVSHAIDTAVAAASRALDRGVFWNSAQQPMDQTTYDTLSLMGELDDAIERHELEVHYQPKLALVSNRVESAEALVRWFHPVHGRIGPDVFIPLAERHDRIERLTLMVTRAALDTIARLDGVSIAVNLSAKLLSDARFNRALDALLEGHAKSVTSLIFEVTESAAMSDLAAARLALEAHRARGITISMDDYGTGQSTLSYLRELPIAELKIDRMFVQNAHTIADDAVLVRSTIELAHQLGIRVVAEGVEDQGCLDFLREAHCDYAQGWLVGKPVPQNEFIALCQPGSAIAA